MKYLGLVLLAFVFCGTVEAQHLQRVPIKSYELRWNDSESKNPNDLSLWHPTNVPRGYYVMGSIGMPKNSKDPNGSGLAWAFKTSTQYKGKELVVAATGFKKVWHDSGTGAKKDGSIWKPECPRGYGHLGLVAQSGYDEPDLNKQRVGCVLLSSGLLIASEFYINPFHTWVAADSKGNYNPFSSDPEGTVWLWRSEASYNNVLVKGIEVYALRTNLTYAGDLDKEAITVKHDGRTYQLFETKKELYDVSNPGHWIGAHRNGSIKSIGKKDGQLVIAYTDGTTCPKYTEKDKPAGYDPYDTFWRYEMHPHDFELTHCFIHKVDDQ